MKAILSVVIVCLLAILTGTSHFAHASTSTASTVTTLTSSADTYVDSGAPNTNYGAASIMWVRGSTPTRRALLRFTLSSVPAGAQITSAVLRLYVSNNGSAVSGRVNAVSGSWAEGTVTYASAPAVGTLVATIPNPATANGSVSVNVTSLAIGKSRVNLYVTSTSTDGVAYYTRETGSSLAPRLIVTWSLAPTPTSTSSGSPTAIHPTATPALPSLSLPLRLAFYYPWFPENWTLGTIYPYTNYHPTLGFYDSSNSSVISRHIKDMQYARIQGGIAAWWGPGSATDNRIAALLAAASGTGFKWTLYYEAEGLGNPSAATITSDLAYIRARYAGHPEYLRVAGKPVLFVYADGADGCSMVDRWKTANAAGFYLVLKVFAGYATCANQPDNWHQYGPAQHYSQQASHSVSVSPGYWRKGESALLTRDVGRWYQDIAKMVAAHPDFQLVTTWNEWADGSSVEPSAEFGRAYLDALHTNGADPTIMAAGDIICDSLTTTSAGCQQMAVSQLVVDQQPLAALILGDLCHTPSVDCFDNYYDPSWGRFFSISRPATGNHDYLVPGAVYYFDYWNGTGNFQGRAGDRDKGYYSFDVGTWHLIALNSQCSQVGGCNSGSPQYTWLQKDLEAHSNRCTLAYYHIPVFSSGGRANNNMRQIFGLLYSYNAEVILNGHDHIYERFAPQDANGVADPLRGIREFISGTGGANHTSIATVQPNSEVRNASTFGVLRLTLRPNSYDWKFVPVAGQTFTDSGTTLCH